MSEPFPPIGVIHSCFKEKFGIPRQPGLAAAATATLELFAPYDCMEALRGLETVSHIWVLFVFHANGDRRWNPTVRPPRLGGNRRMGVFATRSGFRPNPIGLSAVRLTGLDRRNGTTFLQLKGVDLLDGTPVLDIKPYLPYADAIANAETGFAKNRPEPTLEVVFLPPARAACLEKTNAWGMDVETLIIDVLAADPRPAYTVSSDGRRNFGIRLLDFDLCWRVDGHTAIVMDLVPVADR